MNTDSIARDRYRINVAAESVSRALSFIGGLVSTVILWRSIAAGMWTTDDYGIIKVLTNASQALLPLVLLGISGAIIRVAAEYSTDKEKIGKVISSSILIVTVAYFVIILSSVVIGLDSILLESAINTGFNPNSLMLYWIFVLVTLLPTAYLRITKSVFSGIQQMKRSLYVDIVYSLGRIIWLVALFVLGFVNIFNIMLLNLILAFIAASLVLFQLHLEMRKNSIKWSFRPSKEILGKLGRLASVALIGSIVSANLNSVTVLWMNAYGTLENVSYFSIAQGITLTARMILAAPLAALAPNLTFEYTRKRFDQLHRKFAEAYRMVLPTYAYSFAVIFAFSIPILRVVYGADSLGAGEFIQLLSFNLLFIVTPGLYYNLLLSMDDVRGMIVASLIQFVIQTVWIIALFPFIGVRAIALIWVVYIPYFIVMHIYAGRKHGFRIDPRILIGNMLLGGVFAFSMWSLVNWISPIVDALPILDIVGAALICTLAIPLWYLFILGCTVLGFVNSTDIKNMESMLRIIPPVWWVSKPIVKMLSKIAMRKESQQIIVE